MKWNKTILFIPDPLGRPRRSILHEIEQNNQRGGNKEEGEGVEANNKNNTWHTETCFIWREKNSERKEPSHNCSPLRILLTDERMTQQVLDGENTGHLIYLMIRLYQGAASSTDSMIFFSYFISVAFVS